MTVASTTNKVSYTATASQTTFAYTFKIFADADLKVYVNDVLKTLTTDYTVTNAGVTGGGNVIFGTGRTASEIITIERVITATQLTDYVENDPFAAETHENALDKLTMLAQQNESASNNSVRAPTTDVNPNMLLDKAATRATKMLGFDADGDPIMSASTVDEIDASVTATFATGILASAYQFTGDGTTVDFTLGGGITDIPNSQSVIVDIDGITQHTDTYTVSGKVVTFSVAPPLNGDIQVRYNAYLGTATDASGITYNQGGTGASSRTVENKLQESVSVKDFGAVGDGVTDDTTAIQAALDSGEKNILLPTGTYKTTSVLNRPSQVRFYGDGCFTSQIVASHNGVIIATTPGSLEGDTYNSIEDIGFKNAATYNSSIGISLANMNQVVIKRVRVEDGPVIGIQCVYVLNSVFEQVSFIDCSDIGLYIYSSGAANGNNRNVYSQININNCATGIRLDGTGTLQSVFSDVSVETATVDPVLISNGYLVVFDRLYLEGNTNSVKLTGGDNIIFRNVMNVSVQEFINSTGFAATNVSVDRLEDYGSGAGILANANITTIDQGQIKFPSTQIPSSDVNTLDDYKEGTWEPLDNSGAGLTFTLGACTYTKIGRIITAHFDITYPTTADGSNAIVSGLPYTAKGLHAVAISISTEATLVRGTTGSDENYFVFYDSVGGLILNSTLSTKVIRGTIIYHTT